MVLNVNDTTAMPYTEIEEMFRLAKSPKALYGAIANAPFQYPLEAALLFLGFITFFTVDEDKQIIRLTSVSDTEHYRLSIADYPFKPFRFELKLTDSSNHIARAIREEQEVHTDNWESLKRPKAHSGAVRLNQASAGIAYSVVRPVSGGRRGALLYNYFQYKEAIGAPQQEFMDRYTDLVATAIA